MDKDKYNFLCETAGTIDQLVTPLKKFGVEGLTYGRYYEDHSTSLLTTVPTWIKHLIDNQVPMGCDYSYLTSEVLWCNDFLSPEVIQELKDRGYSNIFALALKQPGYTELFHFGSSADNPVSATFYFQNLSLIYRFIDHFKNSTEILGDAADKYRLQAPPGSPSLDNIPANMQINEVDFLRHFVDKDNMPISYRELECIFCLSKGKTAKETALILGISPRTVENHIAHAKDKLNCSYKGELIQWLKQYRKLIV